MKQGKIWGMGGEEDYIPNRWPGNGCLELRAARTGLWLEGELVAVAKQRMHVTRSDERR